MSRWHSAWLGKSYGCCHLQYCRYLGHKRFTYDSWYDTNRTIFGVKSNTRSYVINADLSLLNLSVLMFKVNIFPDPVRVKKTWRIAIVFQRLLFFYSFRLNFWWKYKKHTVLAPTQGPWGWGLLWKRGYKQPAHPKCLVSLHGFARQCDIRYLHIFTGEYDMHKCSGSSCSKHRLLQTR